MIRLNVNGDNTGGFSYHATSLVILVLILFFVVLFHYAIDKIKALENIKIATFFISYKERKRGVDPYTYIARRTAKLLFVNMEFYMDF